MYYALTEGAERALVADLAARLAGAPRPLPAVTGAMLLPASLLTGALWQHVGAPVALGTGAWLAALAAVSLVALVPETARRS